MENSRISEDCMSAARDALKLFTDSDLEKYVAKVFEKARSYENLHKQAAIEQAIKDVGEADTQAFLEQMQIQVNDAAKFELRADAIKNKKATLLNTLVRRWDNWSNNVESAQRAAQKRLMDKFFNILKSDELAYLTDHNNDMEIARAIDGKPAHDTAKAIAEKFKEYIKGRNGEMVGSDALNLLHINRDRSLRAIHDPGRILRAGRNLIQSALAKRYTVEQARDIWREHIRPLLNLKETFSETDAIDLDGNVDMAKVDSALNDIFDNITTGKPEIFMRGGKQNMFFYWKDTESWVSYNKQYGRGDLLSAMRADVQASGNKIGMAEMLGSNPQSAYNDLAELENQVNPQSAGQKYRAKLSYQWVAGMDKAPVSPNMATFFSAIRGLTSAAKLVGRVTLLSIPDVANGIMFAHRYGYSYFSAYSTYLGGMFNALKSEERTYIAGLFKEMTDTHAGHMMRFMEANDAGQLINSVNSVLYRTFLMDALDRGNKVSAMQIMARIMGDNSHLEHSALPEKARDLLDKFNLSDAEWNMLRTKTKVIGSKKLLTTDAVDALTNDELRKIYGVDNDVPLHNLRKQLHRKVYSMFDVASENAVLTPGAFMKASSQLGTRSGTLAGELLRSVMQFKMYPLEYMDRVIAQGLRGADGVQGKLLFGALLVGATLPLSWLSMFTDNISKGKTMPDWDDMSFGERVDYSKNLLAPSLGFLGNFMSEDTPFKNAGALFTTPAIQLMWDSIKLPYRTVEGVSKGDYEEVEKAVKKIGQNIIPGISLPFVSPYMRLMFGDKPYLQPGQVQLYGA